MMNRPPVTGTLIVAALAATLFNCGGKTESASAAPTGSITGVVQSEKGPEAGVWVIAETSQLPTGFIKIVVTDDQGRFALPELPDTTYKVWVRGYGLLDSAKTDMKPTAENVTLKVDTAKTDKEAAQVYPGDYWLSLMQPPTDAQIKKGKFTPIMQSQNHWINSVKSDCNFCHQLGNQLTRTLDDVYKGHPESKTSHDAWDWRLGAGTRGSSMYQILARQGMGSLDVFADWTDRIAAGEVPPAPPRPKGMERNVVLTLWDVGDDHSFMHDQISTDKLHPSVNANGPNYAVNAGHGQLVILDQAKNTQTSLDIPTREPRDSIKGRFPKPVRPSLHWGDEWLWETPKYNPADPHNPMLDSKGRVWMTSRIRDKNPAWCMDPSNKFAEWFPLDKSGRQASYYDPKTKEFTLVETCYGTHHLQFDNDADETLYLNELTGPIFGWIDTKVLADTKDEQKAVGWCPQIVDTNGDGKITKPWNVTRVPSLITVPYQNLSSTVPENTKFDPTRDTLVDYNLYALIPSPVDDSVWGVSESYPGYLIRLQRGDNPPITCRTQVFKVPAPGFDPRGIDIASDGVVWTALAASSHMASFDVRKCKDLSGKQKTDGSQCPEGWTLYKTTGPKMKGTDIPADFHYYNWVDQQNVSGLGANTPLATGSNSDSLLALNPQTGEWTTLRVPYPLGFYSRGLDGRIDDPNAGWKGRALYSNYGTHFVWHIEGGKGTKGKIVKFQFRPDPLAR
jgi:hypothetical protein